MSSLAELEARLSRHPPRVAVLQRVLEDSSNTRAPPQHTHRPPGKSISSSSSGGGNAPASLPPAAAVVFSQPPPPQQPPSRQDDSAAMADLLLEQVARLEAALREATADDGGDDDAAPVVPAALWANPALLPPLLRHYDGALARLRAGHAACQHTAAALEARAEQLARDNDALHAEVSFTLL
jgi:hypothetical protein